MSLGRALLERTQEWIGREIHRNNTLREISQIEIFPSEGEPRSVSWTLDGANFMAQVVVWNSGEFEEDLANVKTGQVQTRSGHLASIDDLESRLMVARDWAIQDI